MASESTSGGEQKQETCEVWLVADADDYRAMHDYILIEGGGGGAKLFECYGQEPGSAVDALLAAAGFTGSVSMPEVRELPSGEVDFVKIRGFEVSAGARGSMEFAIRVAMQGGIGGLTSVLAGQSGWHRSVNAFEYAWAVAGFPPCRVRHPELVRGGSGSGVPGSIERAAAGSQSVVNTLARAGIKLPGME